MPKETTHQYLAEFIAKEITVSDEFPKVSELLKAAPNLFIMGSVAPDSIFNYTKGPAKEFFSNYAAYSHGKSPEICENGGLFGFLGRFAETGLPTGPALSFGLGAVCHLSADIIFHPPVFYFTGTDSMESNEAMVRHLQFESELDRRLRYIFPELKKSTPRGPLFRDGMQPGGAGSSPRGDPSAGR